MGGGLNLRRKDREINDLTEIINIIKRCDTCRLALNDENYPYILPLNFGIDNRGDVLRLIFHSATEGYKFSLIEKDNRASFEMDCEHELQYFEEKGYCTMTYESVIGRGRVKILSEEEKMEALKRLMEQYHGNSETYFDPKAISRTVVYILEVEEIKGKRKVSKEK